MAARTELTLSLHKAIEEHTAEGGVAGRGGRYASNCRILIDGMRALGFRTLLPDTLQAIATKLPFATVAYAPARLFVSFSVEEAAALIGLQLFWLAVVVAALHSG